MKISDAVSVIYGSNFNCNTYILDNNTLVDPGIERPLEGFLDQLATEDATMDDIQKIVCTHCHYDHIGLLHEIQQKTGAKVFAHALDADAISSGDSVRTVGFGLRPTKIDKLLKEGDMVSGFEILHTPGHTLGSISLWDKTTKTIISGDTVFADGIGRSDLPGGNAQDLKKSLERLAKLGVQTLLPGHGPIVKENAKNSILMGLSLIEIA